MSNLIDTTEMYLKTIYELEEDGVTPLRARIVERLGHSGPTVSQTIARMERDGLVRVRGDRRLELSDEGRAIAVEVMRKHRLAERLLLDVIGVDWVDVHDEACRWEHVMSEGVEGRLRELLEDPTTDPFGNPLPGLEGMVEGLTPLDAIAHFPTNVVLVGRIGEPIQSARDVMAAFEAAGIRPGSEVIVVHQDDVYKVTSVDQSGEPIAEVALSRGLAPHLFVKEKQNDS